MRYRPKEVIKEWGRIEWPGLITYSKTLGTVLLFTGVLAGFLTIAESAGIWLISL